MGAGQTEFQRRLYDAAEAFYYAGIITSVPFDAAYADSQFHTTAKDAGRAALCGGDSINRLGAPPIVNLGLSIELYIKLLINLAGRDPPRGHNMFDLFNKLVEFSSITSSKVIENHRYSCGCKEEFLEYVKNEATVFEKWRYAHEEEFLCSSEDTLFDLANAFRTTVRQMYPDFFSTFNLAERRTNEPDEQDSP